MAISKGSGGNYLQSTNASEWLTRAAPFTAMCWHRQTGTVANAGLLSTYTSSASDGWCLRNGSGTIAFGYHASNVSYGYGAGGPAVTTGEWIHLAVVYNHDTAGDTYTIYANGVPILSQTIATLMIAKTDSKLRIGHDVRANAGINGILADVRIFNKAFTFEEIQLAMVLPGPEGGARSAVHPSLLHAVDLNDEPHLGYGLYRDSYAKSGTVNLALPPTAATAGTRLSRWPYWYIHVLAGTTYNQACSAVVDFVAATPVKRVGKVIGHGVTMLAVAPVKAVGKLIGKSFDAAVAVVKSVGKPMAGVGLDLAVALSQIKVTLLTLAVSIGFAVPAPVKQVGKVVGHSVAFAPAVVKGVGKGIAHTCGLAVAVAKRVGKPLAATSVDFAAAISKRVGKVLGSIVDFAAALATVAALAPVIELKRRIWGVAVQIYEAYAEARKKG